MARHQMSTGLLAKYAGVGRLKVWLHLKPKLFSRLAPAALKRYAEVFDISVRELKTVPETHVSGFRSV